MAFRCSPNLRNLLVHAKLKSPECNTLRHLPGTFRCNSRHGCLTCPNIDDGRTTYMFSITGKTREIKQHITCKSNNLTYMIECNNCKKHYIRETKRSLRERFTEHRQATNNSDHVSASAAVPTHFNLPSHSVKDMLLIPLELQVTNNPSRRKAREAYFIHLMASTDEMNTNFGRFIYCFSTCTIYVTVHGKTYLNAYPLNSH